MFEPMEYIWPGIIAAQAIHAATKLGIADLLYSSFKSVAELAGDSGAHPPSLECRLRALSTLGVFAITPDGRFCNTPLSEVLRSDHKKNGKPTISARIVVSADGVSRTVTASGTDSSGGTFSQHRGI